jgi:hypothetical protein
MQNYPPGVTGNEPQITGIWPLEANVESATDDISKAVVIVEEVAGMLDDQGLLPADIDKAIDVALDALERLRDSINSLVPAEPEFDDYPYGYDDAEADRY